MRRTTYAAAMLIDAAITLFATRRCYADAAYDDFRFSLRFDAIAATRLRVAVRRHDYAARESRACAMRAELRHYAIFAPLPLRHDALP